MSEASEFYADESRLLEEAAEAKVRGERIENAEKRVADQERMLASNLGRMAKAIEDRAPVNDVVYAAERIAEYGKGLKQARVSLHLAVEHGLYLADVDGGRFAAPEVVES